MGQTFTANGNWVCPAGVTEIVVFAWGAGGAGGINNIYGGGGGGGGAFASSVLAVVPGTSYPITVAQAAPTTGGGDSSFSNLVIAKGGKVGGNGGTLSGGTGGAGGLASESTGQVKFNGGNGDAGFGTLNGGGGGGGAGTMEAGKNSPPNTSLGGAGGADFGGAGGNHVANGLTIGGGGGGQVNLNPRGAGARGEVRIGFRYARSNATALALGTARSRLIAPTPRVAPIVLSAAWSRRLLLARRFTTAFGGQTETSQRDEIMADSPFLYWRFEDLDSVAHVADESGNNRTGFRQVVTKLREPGKHNFGIRNSDDAQSNYGYIQGTNADNTAHWVWGVNQPITMMGWFKPSSVLVEGSQPWIWSAQGSLGTTRAYLYRTPENSAEGSRIIFVPDAAITFAWGGTGQGGTLMPRGEWTHLALTYNGLAAPNGTAELFINGVSQGVRTGGNAWGEQLVYWMLGGSPGNLNGYFNGWFDEFAIFFGVKSAARIARYANAPTVGGTTGQMGASVRKEVSLIRTVPLPLTTAMRRGVAVLRSVPLTLGTVARRTTTPTPKLAPMTLTSLVSRRFVGVRSFSVPLPLVASATRLAAFFRQHTAELPLTAFMTRRAILLRARASQLVLTTARQFNVTKLAAAALPLGTAYARFLTTYRSATTALTLNTSMSRFLTFSRRASTALTLTARGRVDMALAVLNRIQGGASNVVKKLLVIFDD